MPTTASTADLMNQATVTVPELATVFGIGKNAAYQLVREGRIRSLKIGRRIVVPISAVRELLGE